MYKDKDKQREANRVAQARFKAKGITEGITNQGITPTSPVIPDMIADVSEHGGSYSFTTVKGRTQDVHRTLPRRGKDITCSSHLPLDIQRTINRLSKDDDQEHNRRTAIAIDYQHKQPDRYYSTGIGGAS